MVKDFNFLLKTIVGGLNDGLRKLLAEAYSKVLEPLRFTLEIFSDLTEEKAVDKRERTKDEIRMLCEEVLDHTRKLYKPKLHKPELSETEAEEALFYLTMNGDYNRYLAEVTTGRNPYEQRSLKAYEAANTVAMHLSSAHPDRLNLSLKFSQFYRVICHSNDMARLILEQAIAGCSDPELEDVERLLGVEALQESNNTLRLLRDRHRRLLCL